MIATGLAALKQYRQFIVYRTEPDAITGKLNKIPTVSVTDSSKWISHDAASKFASQYPGKLFVGFVLRPELSRIAVVDVDGCRDKETGKLSDLALTMIATLPGAYVEVSISGTGIHIWFSYSGEILPHACRVNGLEFYHTERFFALGTEYGAEGFINGTVEKDLTPILPSLIATYFPPAPSSANGETLAWTDGPCEEWNGPADDRELLRRAIRTIGPAGAFDPDKATFSDLWGVNEAKLSRAYPDSKRSYDASAADAALAQHLAFWTGNDCERIKRMMEGSGLVRDKWERGDYLTRTILNAVARQTKVFQDKRPASTIAAPAAGGITLTPIERTLANVGTQDAVALIFTQRMKGKMLYDRTRNAWLEYDGIRWTKDQLGKAYNLIRDISRELNYDGKASMGAASFCEGVDRHLQSAPEFARTTDQFDLDNYLLNTPAGTFDLRTWKMQNTIRRTSLPYVPLRRPSPEGERSS
jgi:primase-polymerase (primpol)-like protein